MGEIEAVGMYSASSFDLQRYATNSAGGLPLSVSRAGLVVLTVAFAVARLGGISFPIELQAGSYLFGMVALNLPHGGFEHFENLRRRLSTFQVRYVALYLALVGSFAGLFFIAPVAGLALAIAVAVAKGGLGDLQVLKALGATAHLQTRPQRWLAAAVRGGAVMLVPVVFFTETFYEFSSLMVGLFDEGALAAVAVGPETARLFAGSAFGLLLVAHLLLGALRAPGTGAYRTDVFETLLLTVYFAVVPVVVAVGLYFPLWYSARQVARTNATEDDVFTDRGDFAGLLSPLDSEDSTRIALSAWGLLVAGSVLTFGLAAGLWLGMPNPPTSGPLLPGLVAFWSIFISIIALPHIVVGTWLDRDRGIWYVP